MAWRGGARMAWHAAAGALALLLVACAAPTMAPPESAPMPPAAPVAPAPGQEPAPRPVAKPKPAPKPVEAASNLAPPASAAPRASEPQRESEPEASEGVLLGQGLASWYGPGLHGRPTASGERFDRYAFTAAHRTLPFGTRVCVRSLVSGKTVMVRINDRGPFGGKERVVDLSEAAAHELGMVGLGIKPVELWQVDEDDSGCLPALGEEAARARREAVWPSPASAAAAKAAPNPVQLARPGTAAHRRKR